ncbi:MAG: Asp-tRNA(Asn)/Glu-tRNA(Gln) amidotransferase subunit GatC [Alphaproteobacteria bacterium]|jgi:aspartyl-tRNA(Asn)/glutamyl-tRNA(Gln) amidotransferase subunit C|nr:Asp-tRNA(Asn)/Glu-tRNA(Gln) amidotransferase subunit GatC [Alphaproteobacteria bacterium]
MSLDKDTVRKIAFLARMRVPDDALAPLAGELSNIIGWVEQLSEVDTEGVDAMTSVADMTWPRRDDGVKDGGLVEEVLANATEPEFVSDDSAEGGFYTVPKVVE